MQFLTMRKTAEFLGISYDTFWKMAKEGGNIPPHIMIGKRKRWVKEVVENWAINQSNA